MFNLTLNEVLKLSVAGQARYKARKDGYMAKSKGDPMPLQGVPDSAWNDWVYQGANIYTYGATNVLGHNNLAGE